MSESRRAYRLKRLKLKSQFRFMVTSAFALMLAVQIIYLVGFGSLTTERAMNTATQQMSQLTKAINTLARNVENSASMITYSEYVQELMISTDPQRNHELYPYVMEMFTGITTSNPNVYSVFLLNNGTRKISDPIRNDEGMTDTLVRENHIRSVDFVKPAFIDHVEGYHDTFYTYVFPIFHSYLTGDGSKIGCGVLTLNLQEVEQLLQVDGATQNSQFLLLDQSNRVIAGNQQATAGNAFTNVFWSENDHHMVKNDLIYHGERSIAQFQTIESTGWKIVSMIPVSELTSDITALAVTGMGVSFFMLLVMVWLNRLTSRNVSVPVETIADFLADTTHSGDLHQRLTVPQQPESGIIAENINLLLDKVEQMTEENMNQQAALFDAKLEEKQAQIQAMQSQINPHFLYNTLNCLSSIGLAYDAMEVVSISNAMSDIFRYSIKGDSVVTVEQELDCIRKYLQIMEARYPNRFTVTFDVDPALLNCRMLKMTLQPIVENAMYHGIEQIIGHGQLLIEGVKCGENEMRFVIQDNGKGMSAEALEELKNGIYDASAATSSIGLGLRNIYKRIQLQLGTQYGFDIESEQHSGTRVILHLPIMPDKRT